MGSVASSVLPLTLEKSDYSVSQKKSVSKRPSKEKEVFFKSETIMDGRGALSEDPAFLKLKELHAKKGDSINIANLFSSDPERFEKFRYVIITLTEVVCICFLNRMVFFNHNS